jgi:hypothetical protein
MPKPSFIYHATVVTLMVFAVLILLGVYLSLQPPTVDPITAAHQTLDSLNQ